MSVGSRRAGYGAAILLSAAVARAELRPLVRLTAGPSDEFSQSPDAAGDNFVFVSTESVSALVQIASRRRLEARVLFDEGAPVATPVLSPDGKTVAYISFKNDAKGDVCVRAVNGESVANCLTGSLTRDSNPLWAPDGKGLYFVARRGVDGVPHLRKLLAAGARPAASEEPGQEVVLAGGVASPALSPDGRYVAYVPIESASEAVGVGLAPKSRPQLRLADLQQADRPPVDVPVPFPGISAFPAFAKAGDFIYFTQYVNDTNGDGHIDGRDAGVILRVPFSHARDGSPVADGARTQQLTTAQVGCQYPTPSAKELFVTCAKDGSLDVYATALDGRLAATITDEQLADEGASARSRFDKLLVRTRQLERAKTPDSELSLLLSIVRIHLSLREFDGAAFYLDRYSRAAVTDGDRRTALLLGELTAQRSAEIGLGRGDLSATFVADAHARITRVTPYLSGYDAATEALALLVCVEVNDVLGETDLAIDLAKRMPWSKLKDPDLIALLGKSQMELSRRMDDRAAALALGLRLASHPALAEGVQLGWGARVVRDALRGSKVAGRDALLETISKGLAEGGSAAFRIAVERALLPLGPARAASPIEHVGAETEEKVRENVFAVYLANRSFERRRSLIEATMRAGAEANAGLLLANFAKTWIGFVDDGTAERPYAEGLYRGVMLERAYLSRAKGVFVGARADYFAVLLVTDSLEAIEGFLDMRKAEGQGDGMADLRGRFGSDGDARVQFAHAYVGAQRLAQLSGTAHEEAALAVLKHLDAAADRFGGTCELQHLWAVVEGQRFLRTGNSELASIAKGHARFALDMCTEMPRFLASTRALVAAVESALGNFGEVVSSLNARALLPTLDANEALALCLMKARAQFHLGEDEGAKVSGERCAALLTTEPALIEFHKLVTQRRALYALGAGYFPEAAAAFQELSAGSLPGDSDDAQRLTVALGLAASELGRGHGGEALVAVQSARSLVERGARAPAGPFGRPLVRGTLANAETWRRDAMILLDGMAGEAHLLRGEAALAEPFVAARLATLGARFKATGLDEDLEAEAMGEARLGDVMAALGRTREAATRFDHALGLLDAWGRRTGTPYGDGALDVLLRFGEMALTQTPAVRREAHGRLERAFTVLARLRDPRRARRRDELAMYLAMLGTEGRGAITSPP